MLVDSDVLIWSFRGYPQAARRLDQLPRLIISAITYLELLQGMRSGAELAAKRREREEEAGDGAADADEMRQWKTMFLHDWVCWDFFALLHGSIGFSFAQRSMSEALPSKTSSTLFFPPSGRSSAM